MRSRITLRLAGFEAAIVLVVILVGWTGYIAFKSAFGTGRQTSKRIEETRLAFKQTQDECYRIADHIHAAVSELNQTLFRFVTLNNPSDWENFERKSREVKVWITEQKTAGMKIKMVIALEQFSFSMSVLDLLEDIDRSYDIYLTSARQIRVNSSDPDKRNKAYENTVNDSRQLFALGGRARGRGEVIGLLQTGETKFPWQKLVLFCLLVTLVLLGGWFTMVVYRREVMPMQAQLVESKTIIERQQKLAHFGELAAGLAHEIRNPLTAINARLFTLQKGLQKDTAEHEDASVIRKEIVRLDRIVKDFLDLARPTNPKLIPMSAENVLKEVCDLLSPQFEKQSIRLQFESAVDTRFKGDQQQIKQVLINLVQNAAQSIEHDGVIKLRARRDTRQLQGQASEAVVIEVEDTGPGIPAEVQERLFDPFFSTRTGGTGLGLPISARIIETHGGQIGVQTQVGHGTTFSIILPACHE